MSKNQTVFRRNQPERFIRLLSYFQPYPHFLLKISANIVKPVVIVPNNGLAGGGYSFAIFVSSKILLPSAPEYLEKLVLRYALEFADYYRKFRIPLDQSPYLEPLFRIRKKLDHPPIGSKSRPSTSSKELRGLWLSLIEEYFPQRLDLSSYRVVWSKKKHKSSLASCSIDRQKISVAYAMNRQESKPFLEALLYHELCHAVLGRPKIKNGRRVMHGHEFKALEHRHPGTKLLDQWIRSGGWRKAATAENRRITIERKNRSSLPLPTATPTKVERTWKQQLLFR